MSEAGEFEGAFAASAADHDQAMLGENQPRVVSLAQYRLAAVYGNRGFIEVGGLAFYGQVQRERVSSVPRPSSTRS